jgi:amidase
MGDELWRSGAVELAARIAKREVSSVEVVEAHLARIDAVNGSLNAVTVILGEEARAAAASADRALAASGPTGPFHGVPLTVKENIDVAGSATTQGVAALANAIAPVDAPVVARMRAAGAIPIGRTNAPDFGLRAHTDNALRGPTLSPWDPSRTPGGSSGGEGVAVATGMSPIGLGNDVGGSVRIPAQCNGVCGLRPSLGRVPWASSGVDEMLFVQLMAVEGPMARTVGDLRAALAVLAGPDVRDPWSLDLVTSPAQGPVPVGVVAEPDGGDTDPAIAAAVRRAADVLADAGYPVEEVATPPIAEVFETWMAIFVNELEVLFPVMGPLMGEGGRRFLEHTFAEWPPGDRGALVKAWTQRRTVGRAWRAFQIEHPLLLAPVMPFPPFETGFDIDTREGAVEVNRRLRVNMIANLLGLPAVALPVGVTDGLPDGVQIIGPHAREDLCLDAAEAIEARLGTHTPIDPVEVAR